MRKLMPMAIVALVAIFLMNAYLSNPVVSQVLSQSEPSGLEDYPYFESSQKFGLPSAYTHIVEVERINGDFPPDIAVGQLHKMSLTSDAVLELQSKGSVCLGKSILVQLDTTSNFDLATRMKSCNKESSIAFTVH